MAVVPLANETSPFIILRHRISLILPHWLLQFAKKQFYAQWIESVTEDAEKDLIVLKKFVRPGECVVDAGANVGIYSKFLSRWVGTEGQVYSIEPIPMTFKILCSNIRKLSLNNVCAINCAVSETTGFAAMEVPIWSSGAENFFRAAIVQEDVRDSSRRIQVRTTTLDSLLAAASKPVSFIKLDVEGHELQCIRGTSATIRNSRPAWLLEIQGDPADEADVAHTIFDFMLVHGYQPFWFDGKALIKYGIGHRSLNFWFLLPEHLEKLRAQGVSVN